MLETVLTAALTAVLVSAIVHSLLHWQMRLRVRAIEFDLADWQDRVSAEAKRRAAAKSVEVRRTTKVNPIDQALVARHTGVDLEAALGETSVEQTLKELRGPTR